MQLEAGASGPSVPDGREAGSRNPRVDPFVEELEPMKRAPGKSIGAEIPESNPRESPDGLLVQTKAPLLVPDAING